MNAEVMVRADALIEEILKTEEYAGYAEARESVLADPVSASMLSEYRRLRSELQAATLAGVRPDEENVKRFGELSMALQFNSETAEFLKRELVYQTLLSEVMKKLSKITDIDAEILEV